MSASKSILTEAEEIVNGPRQELYGSLHESFTKIGKIAELLLTEKEWEALASRKIPNTIICRVLTSVKLQRESIAHKRDNLVDNCGYAHILNELEEVNRLKIAGKTFFEESKRESKNGVILPGS